MASNTSPRASAAEYSAAGSGTSVSVSHSRACTAPLAPATRSRTTTVPAQGGSCASSCARQDNL